MTVDDPRYRFAGADGTLWLGLQPLPVIALGLTVAAAVALLYAGAPLPVGVLVLLAGAVATLAPVGGRGLIEWLPATARHLAAVAAGDRCWSAHPAATSRSMSGLRLRLPREYGRLRLLDIAGIGAIDDPAARAVTVVLTVAGTDRFPLLDPPEQARLLAAWGAAIAALTADTQVRRVQWVERATPDRRDVADWLNARTEPAMDTAAADYRSMVDAATENSVRHEVCLAIAYRRQRDADTTLGIDALVRDSVRSLLSAELLARPLSAEECGRFLRRASDPDVPDDLAVTRSEQTGPASRVRAWDHLRTDDTYHRSFAVTGWPRIPVGPAWLEPLLLATPADVTRTVSVHLESVAAAPALRQARAARSRARLDVTDRARLGLVDSAAGQAAADEATATEEELVAGFRLQRLSGVVTVSASSLPALDDACRSVRAAASAARLDLRACHGEHDRGLLASLPLCRVAGRSR
jgi:hypothetical protein